MDPNQVSADPFISSQTYQYLSLHLQSHALADPVVDFTSIDPSAGETVRCVPSSLLECDSDNG